MFKIEFSLKWCGFHKTLQCVSVFLVYCFFSEWKREVSIEQTWFLSTVFLCGEFKLENIYSGVHFLGKNFGGTFYCRNLFWWIAEKTLKSQTLETAKILCHTWIANMLLCPYEIKSKLSLYYHPCRVNICQKDFKLICGVLCGPKLLLNDMN